uniref:Glutamine amidotransferase domain-containing protein n=1 Tax=Globisporangium ultimum (strain ATCC 200006 / CBS 805.95 / DAOM BR144) TaxID=431595 RepID=K3WB82_GLOUD
MATRSLQMLRRGGSAAVSSNALRAFSTKPRATPLSVLVIDGYSKEGREDLQAGGASTAGKLYQKLLKKCTPQGNVVSDIVYPADADFTTPDLSKYHAVAWTGCSLTIYETEDERVSKQIDFAKKAYEYGIPQYGSCWAAQIAVMAANGHCGKNPRGREMGIARKIALTPEGRAHPMFEGKPTVFDAFTSHNDEITHISPGGLHLAGSDFTSVQAVAVRHLNGEFWGVQYHPEYDLHELARLTYCRRAKLVELGFFPDMKSADDYVDDLENLHIDPNRYDIAWRLGIDADVMDDTIKNCETRNFIKHLALPYKATVEGK